jgi:alpha-glucosidase
MVLNNYAAPLDKLPIFVKAGAIVPMYPEMLHDRDKPKDPVTFDVYPFGKTSFNMYEDDGTTQKYRTGAFARTLIEVEAPKDLDAPEAQIDVRVGPAKGKYNDMPANRLYAVDVHVSRKPANVRLAERALPVLEKKADFDAAREGWFFDARERRGVLHVKTTAQATSAGFSIRISM